jgi:hypothetical protein
MVETTNPPSHQLINQTSGKVEYYTPRNIVEAARLALGVIDLDPASCEVANGTVKATRFFTQADDGLKQDWSGRVWMNHPFGKDVNKLWINKLVREYRSGRVTAACCITWACTSEQWFQPLICFPQCFLFPRTNYLLETGAVLRGSTKGSVVTYMGENVTQFAEAFCKLGAVKIEYEPKTGYTG